jgi:hypothetical protein
MSKTTNENPKCHLHLSQPKKSIDVLNIIVQSILEKKECEGKGSIKVLGVPKTIMPPTGILKPDGSKNPNGNPKTNQIAHLWC